MKKSFLYLAACPTFGLEDDIKVGISDNPKNRINALNKLYQFYKLKAVFEFENRDFPIILECAVVSQFYSQALYSIHASPPCEYIRSRVGREFFSGKAEDFISYIENKAVSSGEIFRRVL